MLRSLKLIIIQRKLPWESTLQVSLTLALVNPVLWYLVDRSIAGFLLSSIIGLGGTAVCLSVNPDMVPSLAAGPLAGNATDFHHQEVMKNRLVSTETISVGTWVASVLFCSCVCFGNIGRRLSLSHHRQRGSPP